MGCSCATQGSDIFLNSCHQQRPAEALAARVFLEVNLAAQCPAAPAPAEQHLLLQNSCPFWQQHACPLLIGFSLLICSPCRSTACVTQELNGTGIVALNTLDKGIEDSIIADQAG